MGSTQGKESEETQKEIKNHEKVSEDKQHPKCKKKSLCHKIMIALFFVFDILTMFKCLGVMAITVLEAITLKMYLTNQNGRSAAMVVIAVTAAISFAMTIYAMIGYFRNNRKYLFVAAIVLSIMAIVQGIITGSAVWVTDEDQAQVERTVVQSFRLSTGDNPKFKSQWSAIQNGLNCCGLYSPEDYRPRNSPYYFPPNVPVSCCPEYNTDSKSRSLHDFAVESRAIAEEGAVSAKVTKYHKGDGVQSDLAQERTRERCRAKKTYFNSGCKSQVMDAFNDAATIVISLVSAHIVIESALAVIISLLSNKMKRCEKRQKERGKEMEKEKAKP